MFRVLSAALLLSIFAPNLFGQDLIGRIHTGYQGWFTCEGDQAKMKWHHWGRHGKLEAGNLTVDMFPDLRDYPKDKLYESPFTFPNGDPVKLFSSNDYETVDLHFKWMREYGIDGVFLQRFLSPLKNRTIKAHRDKVLEHVIKASQKYGRKFAVMYDLSGYDGIERKKKTQDFKDFIAADWDALNKKYGLVKLPGYMHEDQRPVLAIWGIGFSDRVFTDRYARDVVELFKQKQGVKHRNTYLLAGVPSYWRKGFRDAEKDPIWKKLYLTFDMVSPWSVGRYSDTPSLKNYHREVIEPDLAHTKQHKVGYMPVVFPGFSWGNLKSEGFNSIPRRGGKFMWEQVVKAKQAGANCLYIAMFDEVDEATAIFKLAEDKSMLPAQGRFVALDADGQKLPSDWYLRIASAAGEVFRGERAADPTFPDLR